MLEGSGPTEACFLVFQWHCLRRPADPFRSKGRGGGANTQLILFAQNVVEGGWTVARPWSSTMYHNAGDKASLKKHIPTFMVAFFDGPNQPQPLCEGTQKTINATVEDKPFR